MFGFNRQLVGLKLLTLSHGSLLKRSGSSKLSSVLLSLPKLPWVCPCTWGLEVRKRIRHSSYTELGHPFSGSHGLSPSLCSKGKAPQPLWFFQAERVQSFYRSCTMLLTDTHLQAKKRCAFFFFKVGDGEKDHLVPFPSFKCQLPLESVSFW